MVHNLIKNTTYTYIYRTYPAKGTLRYVFSMPISYRGNGEWEAHAWNPIAKLWPEAPNWAHADTLLWLHAELKKVEGRFVKLTGTFEIDRLKAYRRMFRKHFELHVLRGVEKYFNGALFKGAVVEIRPKDAGHGDKQS